MAYPFKPADDARKLIIDAMEANNATAANLFEEAEEYRQKMERLRSDANGFLSANKALQPQLALLQQKETAA